MSKFINLRDIRENKKITNTKLIKSKYSEEEFEIMKNGYIEMGNINLSISEYIDFQEEELHYKFDDINEYERWLCGV